MPYRTGSILVLSVIFLLSYNVCHSCDTSSWTKWIHFSDQLGHNLSTRYRSPNDSTINCSYKTSICCYELNMTDSNVVHTGRTDNATLLDELSCSSNGQVDRNEKGERICKCPRQYTGIFCEIRINSCLWEQCLNDGICVEDERGYHCICKPGFKGEYCEKTVSENNPQRPEENGDNNKEEQREKDNKLLTVYVTPVLIVGFLFLILLAAAFAKKAIVKSYANVNVWYQSQKRKNNQEQLNVKPPLTPEEMRKLEELQLLSNMEVIRLTFPYNPDKRSDSPNEPTETITLNETRSTTISPEDEDADDPFQTNKDEIVLQPNQQGESQIDDS